MYQKSITLLILLFFPCFGYASNGFVKELETKLSKAVDRYFEQARQYKALPIWQQNSWLQPTELKHFDEINLNLFSFYSPAEVQSQLNVIKKEFPNVKINNEGTYLSIQMRAEDARRLLIGMRSEGRDLLGLKAIDLETQGERFSNPNWNLWGAPYKKYSHFSFRNGIVYKYKGVQDEGIPAVGTYTGLDEFYRTQLYEKFSSKTPQPEVPIKRTETSHSN